MSSVTSSNSTSSYQVRDENENCDSTETSNKSEVSVVLSENRVPRPAFDGVLKHIAESLKKNGVDFTVKSNYLLKRSLEYAVRAGNIKLVKLQIRQGANINSSLRNGSTPLHMAARYGHPEIIELLINNGARVDSVSKGPMKNGFTPLHLACLNNKVKCVKVLLKYGASVTPKCAGVHHPIHIAVFGNHVKVAALLLENGADVNLRFDNKFFYNKWDKSIFWKDMDLTLLHCSIARKYEEMTALLLKHGADIHLNTRSNKTSLMHAVEANDPELVRSFLAKGANPNDRDFHGEPVVFYMVVNANSYQSTYNKEEFSFPNEKLEIIRLLCDAGADVNAKFQSNRPFDSLVHYTCMYGQASIIFDILFMTNFDYRNIDYAAIQLSKVLPGAIAPDDEDDSEFISRLYSSFNWLEYDLLRYIFSRHMIGFPLKEELLSAIHSPSNYDGSPEEHAEWLESIKTDLEENIRYVKQTTIRNTNITFWYVLTCKMTELVRLSFKKEIRSLHSSDYPIELYDYDGIIRIRLNTAIKRSTSIEKSRDIIFDLFHNHLPYDCCEQIATSFNDKELEDFINLCSNDVIC